MPVRSQPIGAPWWTESSLAVVAVNRGDAQRPKDARAGAGSRPLKLRAENGAARPRARCRLAR